ncbi:DUF983 domain-containing protein [Paludibacillus litoralis]|uniref:DUF983 domain-containing protein n=1 Tax=Paludibacillus litoralis TaxID=3133267 RepID=UPI0039B72E90
MKDMIEQDDSDERPLGSALLKGWRRRCPHCGGGEIFDGYLKIRDNCDICGEALHHHRADDAPAWLTILITGHLVGPLMFMTYTWIALPPWINAIAWPIIALTLVIVLLPRVKAGVVAFQWAQRMHGFGL